LAYSMDQITGLTVDSIEDEWNSQRNGGYQYHQDYQYRRLAIYSKDILRLQE